MPSLHCRISTASLKMEPRSSSLSQVISPPSSSFFLPISHPPAEGGRAQKEALQNIALLQRKIFFYAVWVKDRLDYELTRALLGEIDQTNKALEEELKAQPQPPTLSAEKNTRPTNAAVTPQGEKPKIVEIKD